MLKLVLHHAYRNGRATDVSGHNQHGVPIATQPGTGDFSSALHFFHDSRVIVPPSPQLSDLGALRIKVRCMWTPSNLTFDRPSDLVEGHDTFALLILAGGGLTGAVVDATGTWGELQVSGFVHPRQWHDIELRHDGVTRLELLVDGARVAVRHDVPGPVRGVGPLGIAIGHSLIETNHLPTMHGWIDDVQIAKREIEPADVLDPCCADLPTIDAAVREARDAGVTPQQARALVRRLFELETEVRTRVVDNDEGRAQTLSGLAGAGIAALQAGDARAATLAAARTADLMRERLSEGELIAFAQRAVDTLQAGPRGDILAAVFAGGGMAAAAPLGDLLEAFCLPRPPEPEGGGEGSGPILLRPTGDPETDSPVAPPAILDELPPDEGPDAPSPEGRA